MPEILFTGNELLGITLILPNPKESLKCLKVATLTTCSLVAHINTGLCVDVEVGPLALWYRTWLLVEGACEFELPIRCSFARVSLGFEQSLGCLSLAGCTSM